MSKKIHIQTLCLDADVKQKQNLPGNKMEVAQRSKT